MTVSLFGNTNKKINNIMTEICFVFTGMKVFQVYVEIFKLFNVFRLFLDEKWWINRDLTYSIHILIL